MKHIILNQIISISHNRNFTTMLIHSTISTNDRYSCLQQAKRKTNISLLLFSTLVLLSVHRPSAFSCTRQWTPRSQKNAYNAPTMFIDSRNKKHSQINRKQKWMNQSSKQLSSFFLEAELKALGNPQPFKNAGSKITTTTKVLQIATQKLKSGYLSKPERTYCKIIDDLLTLKEKDEVHHTTLAISTILLAWLLQRMGEMKEARKTFLRFFRIVGMEKRNLEGCAISTKVLEAFTHSEVKQGQSYEFVHGIISGWMKNDFTIVDA